MKANFCGFSVALAPFLIFQVSGLSLQPDRNLTLNAVKVIRTPDHDPFPKRVDRKFLFEVLTQFKGHTDRVTSVSYNPKSTQLLASGSDDGTVKIWDMESGENTVLIEQSDPILCLSYSSDGSMLASGFRNGTIKVWDFESLASSDLYDLQTITGHTDRVTSISYYPNGSKLASGSYDGTIKIWEMDDNGKNVVTLEGHTDRVTSVSYNPSGSQLVSGSRDKSVKLWNMEDGGSLIRTFRGNINRITSVTYHPGGSQLALGSDDGTITILDMENFLDSETKTLVGHSGRVICVSYNPDGSLLVSGSSDGTIRVWDMENNSLMYTITNGDFVSSVTFSLDGWQLASGSSDKNITIWKIDLASTSPTTTPTASPSQSRLPSVEPSVKLSQKPSTSPSTTPTKTPSTLPSRTHSMLPSLSKLPSMLPSVSPSLIPSRHPSSQPSHYPSFQPTLACGPGFYTNNGVCNKCAPGTYQGKMTYTTSCIECQPGTYQPEEGGTRCNACNQGSFQPLRGKSSCKVCRAGGYCDTNVGSDTCGGGFTPCPIGTYSGETGKSNLTACKLCPPGTYSGNKRGLIQCPQCPYRLSSGTNSSICTFCAKDFYLKELDVSDIELNRKPDNYCLACPGNVTCSINTTIKTLKGDSYFWRKSLDTQKFYKCEDSQGCQGTNSCKEGYAAKSVLCEACADNAQYFDKNEGTCIDCPPYSRLGILTAAIAGCTGVLLLIKFGIDRDPKFQRTFDNLGDYLSIISIQAKLKIVISFYQVVITLTPIYGVRMHRSFRSWFNFLEFFDLGLAELVGIPDSCYGSMKTRLIISGVWPYALLLLLVCAIFFYTLIVEARKITKTKIIAKFLSRSIHLSIILFYLVLPSISRSIFDAVTCKSFVSDDENDKSESFLISDWNVKCNQEDSEYKGILRTFWALFMAWPIAVPLMFLGLLLSIRNSVRSMRITPLAEACRFLWRDYDGSMMFWEFIDVTRKICLTGIIIFIDLEEGSERILRLVVAIIICIVYASILPLARPYRRNDDLYLAVASNLLLTCCFVVGIIIHQCKEEDDADGGNETCEKLFGVSVDSYTATLLAALLTVAMLIIFILLTFVLAVNALKTPTISLISTKLEPNLDMPTDCEHHIFFSHVWKTGQDKAHKIVRILQQFIPRISIWLDVDSIESIDLLEDSVAKSAIFILFYSRDYFRSSNCCREVSEAMKRHKPITVVYETDDNLQDEVEVHRMKEECQKYFPEGIDYIFGKDPVLWLSNSIQFTAESGKIVIERFLKELPFYRKNPILLDAGLKIDFEYNPVGVLSPLQIMFCRSNEGAQGVALDLQSECRGDVPILDIEGMSNSNLKAQRDSKQSVMLLYLNRSVFNDSDEYLLDNTIKVLESGVPIILVHEVNTNYGGCPFGDIIMQTPTGLKEHPYNLYSENLAVSLYSINEYRKVSLRQILLKMGAMPVSSTQLQVLAAKFRRRCILGKSGKSATRLNHPVAWSGQSTNFLDEANQEISK